MYSTDAMHVGITDPIEISTEGKMIDIDVGDKTEI